MRWFEADGSWDDIQTALAQQVRSKAKRHPAPSAACIDAQSVKSACGGEQIGTDGGKKVHGRKRHILTDTMGLVLAVMVTAANVHDGQAASQVIERVSVEQSGRLELIVADQMYRNQDFQEYLNGHGYRLEISEKAKDQEGFQPLKIRWVVEQTFGCLGRWRRLNQDYEKTVVSSEAFVKLSSIHRMLRRLQAHTTTTAVSISATSKSCIIWTSGTVS